MERDEKEKPSTHLRKYVRLNREDVHLHLGSDEKCPWRLGQLRLALMTAAEPVPRPSSFISSLRRCSVNGSWSTSRSDPPWTIHPRGKRDRQAGLQPSSLEADSPGWTTICDELATAVLALRCQRPGAPLTGSKKEVNTELWTGNQQRDASQQPAQCDKTVDEFREALFYQTDVLKLNHVHKCDFKDRIFKNVKKFKKIKNLLLVKWALDYGVEK